MAHVTPFYQHISPAAGQVTTPAGQPYPYHDDDQCPVGQQVKASDEWQYYRDEPADQRTHCVICAGLASREPASNLAGAHSQVAS